MRERPGTSRRRCQPWPRTQPHRKPTAGARREAGCQIDGDPDARPEDDAEDAADRRQRRRLGEELDEYLRASCAERLADADLLVRSVTEIIMIAITPMPPTISAIDEITTSASSTARLICSHVRSRASCVMMSKSFGSSSRPVPNAHDLLDFGQGLTRCGVIARQDSDDAAEGVAARSGRVTSMLNTTWCVV